ncbi:MULTISPECIES: CGNR zinc finger domain-containing protein [unclassified Streptomyces]|uniref:CGNR zinc finger domain-containing protein n=1 Tax=unclassified Streptomyces TaxID=2593676 RepID=UPI0038207FCC
MEWPATSRAPFPIAMGPGGLALVQDFLNTGPASEPPVADLLADRESAQRWLDAALDCWSRTTGLAAETVRLAEGDAELLLALRTAVREALHARDLAPGGGPSAGSPPTAATAATPASSVASAVGPLAVAGEVALRVGVDGAVTAQPSGTGRTRLVSLLLLEAFQAQGRDTWRRVKVCRNARCPVAFYDRSPNASRVWHDVATCGNRANLRSFRERRRAASD